MFETGREADVDLNFDRCLIALGRKSKILFTLRIAVLSNPNPDVLLGYTGETPEFQVALTQEMAENMVHPRGFEPLASAFGAGSLPYPKCAIGHARAR